MAEKEYQKLSNPAIAKLVEDNIRLSVGYYDSQLSRERKKVLEYYNAKLPKAAHDGDSKYVSQDVYNAVNSMQAALLETFAAGNKIVHFAPQGPEDVETAKVCSSYTDYVLFRQNDAFNVFSTVIMDGLMARVGACKVFWQQSEEIEEQEFFDLTQDELDMLLAEEDVELIDSETDALGIVSGTIGRIRDTSQVVIETIPPEELIVEAQCKSLEESTFCAHRTRKTISELKEMYPDNKEIDEIGDHEDVEMTTDPEILARHEGVDVGRGFGSHGYQDQVRNIMVYEAYIMLDVEGEGIAKLHRVVMAGNVILDIEEVDRRPFITFCPLPIPHSFYGSNFADKLCATQNARTILTRSILNHATITNNPRFMVVKGGLTNPRELIDNRVGGLVNVSRPDAISPLPQAPLNPFVFQTLQQLDQDLEDNTGVSRLSQGLNKDAISKQNSAAMVEQLATMSQQRQKIVARHFATFVKNLFHEVYMLVVQNEEQQKVVEIAGSYVEIDPTSWKEKRDVVVQLKLGYGEQDREAQKRLQLHTLFSQDPGLQPMYSIENRYAMMKSILEQQGILNVDEYLTPPEMIQPPQPNPAEEMQMQMAQKQMEIQERQTAVAELRANTDAQIAAGKMEIDMEKAQAAHALQSDNMDLKEAQFQHKQRIDEAELEVLRRAEDVRGIASPTG
jgi:hypothetical protein